MSKRITFIGGGSKHWTPVLFKDILLTPYLSGSTFVIHDIDIAAAGYMKNVLDIMNKKMDGDIQIVQENSLDAALDGADVVILCISTGGFDSMEVDVEFPKQYGVYQPVGDSSGPGGIFRTLRNVPVCMHIAKKMEKYCPGAWLVNESNPMDQMTETFYRVSSIKAVGLCHEYMGMMRHLSKWFHLTDWKKEVQSVIGGTNHFGWILDLKINGKDGFEMIGDLDSYLGKEIQDDEDSSKLVNQTAGAKSQNVKLALFKKFGYLPYPGDRHISEFLPHFLCEKADFGKKYNIKLTTIEDRRTNWLGRFQKRIDEYISDKPIEREMSAESLAPVVSALLGGPKTLQPVVLPNTGQIDNLPRNSCVETFGEVGMDRINPMHVGSLPDSILCLVHKHCVNQSLSVQAGIEGDRDKVYQCMLADPLNGCNDYETIIKMTDEMLEKHRNILPQFYR